MRRAWIAPGIALTVATAAGIVFFTVPENGGLKIGAVPPGFTLADLETGRELYAQSCAACHGVNLEGQPDWQIIGPDGRLPAPPHNVEGHTWHHADTMLFEYVKIGGQEYLTGQGIEFESGMPSFGDQLSDVEIAKILAFIKSTWPEQERKAQADRTRAELELEDN